MREIKFRAWDKNRSKFYTSPKWVEFLVDLNGKLTARNFGFPHQKGYQQLEINQYTGLKDKNGVEIYEGDIVITPYRNTNGYIYYSAPNFGLKDKIGICTDFTWEDFNEFEVIGNIYEHSHLIDNK